MTPDAIAAWDAFEADWDFAVRLQAEQLRSMAERKALVRLCGEVVKARQREALRAEGVMVQAVERTRRARAELDDAVNLLEQALRLAAGGES